MASRIAARPLIVLFAKAPLPGHAKTRLQRRLTAAQTVALQIALVSDMLEMLQSGFPDADLELHTDQPTEAWARYGTAHRLQAPGDLGARLLTALAGGLGEGRPQVAVLGSDAPTLPVAHVRALLQFQTDVALGPASDGGYYGISCRKTHPRMFDGVAWSGPDTFSGTWQAVQSSGLTVAAGPEWFDVDTPEDLDRLLQQPGLPRHTAAWRDSLRG